MIKRPLKQLMLETIPYLVPNNYLEELSKIKDVLLLPLVIMNGEKKKRIKFHIMFHTRTENYYY